MKSTVCTYCGTPFVSERSEAGVIQSKLCRDCLEDAVTDKNLMHHEVRESWFRLFALEPPPSFFEREADMDEWRTCSECGRRFKTHPDIVSELCPPCLEEAWEFAPPEAGRETPISAGLSKTLVAMKGKKR